MKGIKPAFYVIIAVALIISVCGCTGQTNTTIKATNAPSEIPTASAASASHRATANTLDFLSENALIGCWVLSLCFDRKNTFVSCANIAEMSNFPVGRTHNAKATTGAGPF